MNLFCPQNVKIIKCSGSSNNINDPYAKLYVPDVVKNINVKVFNLMSRTIKTRHIIWHVTCKCKCRLDASVCNAEIKINADVNATNWLTKEDGIKNPSNCDCECDKLCDVREYLDYKNCKCRKS